MTTTNTAEPDEAPDEVDTDLLDAPAASAKPSARKGSRRTKFRRRVSGVLALGIALTACGALYTALAPASQTANAADAPSSSSAYQQGEQIFNTTCIQCHGANLQGEQNRGPSLIGVGSAAVFFQTSTGRMPLSGGQSAQAESKPPVLSPQQIDDLEVYIQAHGGGPQRPAGTGQQLVGDDPARGGQLFRLNCAQCHGDTGQGGALSGGKFAPSLRYTPPDVIYTAMLSGPENMPKFSDGELTPTEKQDIIAYIKSVQGSNNPGGNSLNGLGPISEGFIAWTLGILALVGMTLWIGAKA
ncbi:MAG TPA: cytochrome c [Pseudonocardiaceae bacterium]|jgi:ubiquinol-cytochrome c reductase cytochrome c subunit|nr:cytochrome c [Pseudonocardiaceae bacterium]